MGEDWLVWTFLGVAAWYMFAYFVVRRLPSDSLRGCSAFGGSEAGGRFTVWLASPFVFPLCVACGAVEQVVKELIDSLFGDQKE